MHNNFYFLRQLSPALAQAIHGFRLVSCFTQDKEELVLEFNNGRTSFFLKAALTSAFCCLSFPASFHRARKNSMDLFPEVIMKTVTGVRQFENERSFSIELDSLHLVFKMHGNRANVVLMNGDDPVELFRNHLKADAGLHLSELDRKMDWSREYFVSHQDKLKEGYFTFGKEVWSYLSRQGFDAAGIEKRWELLLAAKEQLERPVFYIVDWNLKPVFTLLPDTPVRHRFSDPIEAITRFYSDFTGSYAFHLEKASALKALEARLVSGQLYISKNAEKIKELQSDTHYQQWADLIMANLGRIGPGMEKISLENFYDDNRPVEIKLNKALNPQRNAEVFYRKGKNQHIEIQKLNDSIALKEKEMEKIKAKMDSIKKEPGLRNFRKLAGSEEGKKNAQEKQSLPYHEFEFKGYAIWVGKNAISNDTLTQQYSYKEDLWLHAKDVAGSHVLVKHQAGKVFPKDVVERAAELAAWYSKRKNESLCPVAVTPKKFVRKRKGDPAGAVVVDRETVMLVTPRE